MGTLRRSRSYCLFNLTLGPTQAPADPVHMCTYESVSFLSPKLFFVPGTRAEEGWRALGIWLFASFLQAEPLERDSGIAKPWEVTLFSRSVRAPSWSFCHLLLSQAIHHCPGEASTNLPWAKQGQREGTIVWEQVIVVLGTGLPLFRVGELPPLESQHGELINYPLSEVKCMRW